jgi:hypothetical protein
MALVDDVVTATLLASTTFFVALSFGLLFRYRQVSQKISASSDLGHDLWQALEERMKKQDERILDMMGRLEVIQSRLMTATAAASTPGTVVPERVVLQAPPQPERSLGVMEPASSMQRAGSQPESQTSQTPRTETQLDETQLAAIKLLAETTKDTRQLTDALGKSREHTARLMKELFELGLVKRNDATKPFVYQLTDKGKNYLL